MDDYKECLRPTFTEYILKDLLKGYSINVYGNVFDGMTRLLEDIQEVGKEDALFFYVNMRPYRQSYKGFINALWSQSGLSGGEPESFAELIKSFENINNKIILLFDNFDAIFGNPHIDKQYDMNFFNVLNSLKNTPNMSYKVDVSFLCTTAKPHSAYVIYIKGKPITSWLELDRRGLESLSHFEINAELERKTSIGNGRLKVTEEVQGHEHPYDFMKFAIQKIHLMSTITIDDKMLLNWKKDYDKSVQTTIDKKAHKISTWIESIIKLAKIDKLLNVKDLGNFIKQLLKKDTGDSN